MDYLALVGRGTVGLKDVFAPKSPMLAVEGDTVSMSHVVGITDRMKWRVWIPPGTRSLQSTLFVYASPPESKVLLHMHEPPTGWLDAVTPENAATVDLTNVLALLLTGAEVPYYAPPVIAGNIKLSDGRIDSPVVTDTGGWLYIHALQVPGNKIFELVARITVDRAQYEAWYANAVWDDYGNPLPGAQAPTPAITEQYVLGRVQELGLVEPLSKLCKATDDAALIQAAKASGLWAALMRFTK